MISHIAITIEKRDYKVRLICSYAKNISIWINAFVLLPTLVTITHILE